ncbi:hypothetical protein BDQ17DRAFT_1429243 [Cyathus striatus]|nr:hypothetical protein BDQ17DRAFT_1429243 [Cyathus striatus]
MPPTTHPGHDQKFLNNVPYHVLRDFHNYTFTKDSIKSNPAMLRKNDWVDVSILQEFMEDQGGLTHQAITVMSSPASSPMLSATPIESSHAHIKSEPVEVKLESIDLAVVPPPPTISIRTHVTRRDSQEVIEILDSSDEDLDSDADVESIVALDPVNSDASESDDDLSIDSDTMPTVWLDDDIRTTKIISRLTAINNRVDVEVVEYVKGIPTAWPIPQQATTYVLDLSDEKYNIRDGEGKLIRIDTLIKNKDRDSWQGTSRHSDSSTKILNILGSGEVLCCRSHLSCQGAWACMHADQDLLCVNRHELDHDMNKELIDAQLNA